MLSIFSWKNCISLLFICCRVVGMEQEILDPWDNGRNYVVRVQELGQEKEYPIKEIDVVREFINRIAKSLTDLSNLLDVESLLSKGWKSIEETYAQQNVIDCRAIDALVGGCSLEQLSMMATFLVTQAWLYDQIKLASEYLAKASIALQKCEGRYLDIVTLDGSDEPLAEAIEIVKLFIPNPIIDIKNLENPSDIAAHLAVKNVLRKSQEYAAGIKQLAFLDKLLQARDSHVRFFALQATRHYYLQKAYQIINQLHDFLLNITANFIGGLNQVSEVQDDEKRKKCAEKIVNEYGTIQNMDSKNEGAQYLSLMLKSILPEPACCVWKVYLGSTFDFSLLLKFASKLSYCYRCHCPAAMSDEFLQSLYICAFDNSMRPMQVATEEQLQKFCIQFDAKKEFYERIYSAIYSRMCKLCPSKRKVECFSYFRLSRILHESIKNKIIPAHGNPLPERLNFADCLVESPASWHIESGENNSHVALCSSSTQKDSSNEIVATATPLVVKKKQKQKQSNCSSKPAACAVPCAAPQPCASKNSRALKKGGVATSGPVVQKINASKKSGKCVQNHVNVAEASVAAGLPKEQKIKPFRSSCMIGRAKWQWDWRIKRWFNAQFASCYEPQVKLYHSFPLLIDRYLRIHGIASKRQNASHAGQTDTVYSLPGEIHYNDSARHYAVFNCTVDPHHVCYHRGITTKSGRQLMNEFGDWVLDIHDINEAVVPDSCDDDWQKVCHTKKLKKYGEVIESQQGYVKVRDSYNSVDCTIYLLDAGIDS